MATARAASRRAAEARETDPQGPSVPTPMRGLALAILVLSGATACTGFIEESELDAPDERIATVHGEIIVPAGSVPPEAPAPVEAEPPRSPAPHCETTMEFMESDDGTTPRQEAMFAPEIERRPWAEMREWFAAAGVALPEDAGMYAFGAGELGQALGEPGAQYDCTRLVEIAGRDAAVCTRSAIVEHRILRDREVLVVDWVLVFAEPDGLVPVTVGPHVASGISFDTKLEPRLDLLPYVRLDLVVVDAARGRLRIEEAAPGACDYACAHAREVERRNVGDDPLAARETAEIADTCAAVGSYVVRGTKVTRASAKQH